jgi:outer membrane protein OmpA-like peptidoglycan-associated protein
VVAISKIRLVFVFAILVAFLTAAVQPAQAQLNGFNIKGDMGLKSGSQAPPGGYLASPLYWYNTDRVNDRFGNQLNPTGSLSMFVGGPLFSYVTPKKFLGASYGFTVMLPFANARIEGPRSGNNPGAGISDLFIQPLSLGWHLKRADVTAGYSIFAPTGRYSVGASDNTGLGMWGHELSLGTTVYLTENKAWHVATSGAFEFHTKKKGVPDHVGTLFTMEGGLGRDIFKGAGSLGLAYYAQWKLTGDTLSGLPALLVQGKNRTVGLGPELNLPLATKKVLFGFFTFRYEWEAYARTTTQGNGLFAMFTFLTKPISLTPPPPANRAPTASCSAARNSVYAGSGDTVAIRADASDADGDTLTYVWSATGGSIDGTGPGVRWNSSNLGVGSYRITANVSDGKGGTASCEAEIHVEPKPNTSPTMSCSMERNSVLTGERVRINVRAGDADSDPLNYSWHTSGGQIIGSGNDVQLDTSGLSAGQYTVTGRVDDGRDGAADCSASLGVTVPPPPPQASKVNECLFRLGSARVDNVCKRILDDVAVRLQNEPRASVVLVGYADPAEHTSAKLSASRAAEIAKYLAGKGISETRMNTRAGGGQAGAGKQNQRVDVVWVPEGATF